MYAWQDRFTEFALRPEHRYPRTRAVGLRAEGLESVWGLEGSRVQYSAFRFNEGLEGGGFRGRVGSMLCCRSSPH